MHRLGISLTEVSVTPSVLIVMGVQLIVILNGVKRSEVFERRVYEECIAMLSWNAESSGSHNR